MELNDSAVTAIIGLIQDKPREMERRLITIPMTSRALRERISWLSLSSRVTVAEQKRKTHSNRTALKTKAGVIGICRDRDEQRRLCATALRAHSGGVAARAPAPLGHGGVESSPGPTCASYGTACPLGAGHVQMLSPQEAVTLSKLLH